MDISIAPEWGYAYILYNLSDDLDQVNPFVSKVAYVSAWTGGGIANNLQNKINSLQDYAIEEEKLINIVDILVTPEWGYAYIVYEIEKDKSRDRISSVETQLMNN